MTTALLKRRPCRVVAYASYRCRRNRTRIDALRVKVYAHCVSSYDCRGHGQSTSPTEANLSLDTLVADGLAVIGQKIEPVRLDGKSLRQPFVLHGTMRGTVPTASVLCGLYPDMFVVCLTG